MVHEFKTEEETLRISGLGIDEIQDVLSLSRRCWIFFYFEGLYYYEIEDSRFCLYFGGNVKQIGRGKTRGETNN